ncbi:hypothetical protein MRY87_06165 [bacterium]|nr:hypothetical protein [bacterium]
MSVYLCIECPGRAPRTIVVRELYSSFGLDRDGLFSTENIVDRWFSILSVEQDYYLVREGEKDSQGNVMAITPGLQVQFGDYSFRLAPTPSAAQVLSQSEITDPEELLSQQSVSPTALLSLKLGNTSKEIPLFEGIHFSLGSSERDLFPLRFNGVEKQHAMVKQLSNSTEITSTNGELLIQREDEGEKQLLTKGGKEEVASAEITLLPSSLSFRIHRSSE